MLVVSVDLVWLVMVGAVLMLGMVGVVFSRDGGFKFGRGGKGTGMVAEGCGGGSRGGKVV